MLENSSEKEVKICFPFNIFPVLNFLWIWKIFRILLLNYLFLFVYDPTFSGNFKGWKVKMGS